MTKEEFKNLEVGETFQLGCRKFTVMEVEDGCDGCFFDGDCYFGCLGYELQENYMLPECSNFNRKDRKNVIFVEVEDESSVEF